MKKFVIFIGVSAAGFVAAGIGAFLTSAGSRINTIRFGDHAITVREIYVSPVPGEITAKNPRACNSGNVDCYVRAKVLLSDSRAEEYLAYWTDEKPGWNASFWQENGENAWLYYSEILEAGEETAPVFTHIQLKDELPPEVKPLVIDVIFESVQAEGFLSPVDAFTAIQ